MTVVSFLRWLVLFVCLSGYWIGCTSESGGDNGENITSPYIIDHSCTDLSQIPDNWISTVREQLGVHYAHTSHGGQITEGLRLLANDDATFCVYSAYCMVPAANNCLSMMDGQFIPNDGYCETYITPDLYWEEDHGLEITRWVLTHRGANVSVWTWCSQLDYYSEAEVQKYLNRMASLESEFPEVIFVYMTGNAQSQENNRYLRNNQIRNYCKNNQKYLLDFADLDSWYNGEQHVVGGIPMEHPQYHGDEAGHTTYESCRNKARAFWWLLARIAGWSGT